MTHSLQAFFEPKRIALFGATDRPDAVGHHVLRNLIDGGYAGELVLVNPNRRAVQGRPCHANLSEVDGAVDLALIATPAASVPGIVTECGAHGTRNAIVYSAGFEEAGPGGHLLASELSKSARAADVHVLGPNCLGLMSSRARINATFANAKLLPGSLALVSQSGALCTMILDWAEDLGVGFSHVVSLGEALDVGAGELLDYLALDRSTQAILVYLEGVRDARHFMSGLRVAARLKPVIVLKAGRHEPAIRAARSHTGALIGADDVFDAALRRAGAVRVNTIGQWFAAAQLLGTGHRTSGHRLGIVTNAGGPGVMAVDHAGDLSVELCTLSAKTLAKLDACLPPHWSHGNPIDILGDATPSRYRDAVVACLADPLVDGLVVMLTPQAMTDPTECANAVVAEARGQKPVVACWLGGHQVQAGRAVLQAHGIPHFDTPEAAVGAFASLWAHHQNQRLLREVAGPLDYTPQHDVAGARRLIESARKEGRSLLSGMESKALLRAFGIPGTHPLRASTADEASTAAERLGFPVALKIDSPDITHKTEVGGVKLGVCDEQAVGSAFESMMTETQRRAPNAKLLGVTVESMVPTHGARELMVGVVQDPCFGPAISVGAGGTWVELLADRAVGLPPLTTLIAKGMLDRTRVAKLLGEWRGSPAVNRAKVEEVLLRVSDLVCELPEIAELDINPLVVDVKGVIALDARVVLRATDPNAIRYAHLAIHPYPSELVRVELLADGTKLTLRPIRPEDAQGELSFVKSLSEISRYFRFMESLSGLTPEMLQRFTQIDYDREMAFIATLTVDGHEKQIGVSRYVGIPGRTTAEFALVIADEWQRQGIGTRLLAALIDVARVRGLRALQGEVLRENHGMLKLLIGLGFDLGASDDPNIKLATKAL